MDTWMLITVKDEWVDLHANIFPKVWPRPGSERVKWNKIFNWNVGKNVRESVKSSSATERARHWQNGFSLVEAFYAFLAIFCFLNEKHFNWFKNWFKQILKSTKFKKTNSYPVNAPSWAGTLLHINDVHTNDRMLSTSGEKISELTSRTRKWMEKTEKGETRDCCVILF